MSEEHVGLYPIHHNGIPRAIVPVYAGKEEECHKLATEVGKIIASFFKDKFTDENQGAAYFPAEIGSEEVIDRPFTFQGEESGE
jgi:hypothetical protein